MPSEDRQPRPGDTVKVIRTEKEGLINQTGRVVSLLDCGDKVLWGVAFDIWTGGHSLRMAEPSSIPEHLAVHIGHNNCWWMHEHEIIPIENFFDQDIGG